MPRIFSAALFFGNLLHSAGICGIVRKEKQRRRLFEDLDSLRDKNRNDEKMLAGLVDNALGILLTVNFASWQVSKNLVVVLNGLSQKFFRDHGFVTP